MSFLKRTQFNSPFAQITNTTAPTVFNRFDTASQSWLTSSGTNGYSAANSKMFITAQFGNSTGICLWGVRLNASTDEWKWGNITGGGATSRSNNDEVCIDYSQTTEYDSPSTHYYAYANPQNIETRFNCIRMEAV